MYLKRLWENSKKKTVLEFGRYFIVICTYFFEQKIIYSYIQYNIRYTGLPLMPLSLFNSFFHRKLTLGGPDDDHGVHLKRYSVMHNILLLCAQFNTQRRKRTLFMDFNLFRSITP